MKKIILIMTLPLLLFACNNEEDMGLLPYEHEAIDDDTLVLRSSDICDIQLESITSHDGYKTKTMANKYQGLITGHEQTITLNFSSPSGDIGFRGGSRFALVNYSSGDKCGTPVISGKTVTFKASLNCGTGKQKRMVSVVLENTSTGAYQIFQILQSTNNKFSDEY